MKRMKLTYVLLIPIFILASCSNNDDSSSNSTSIVGIWKPIKEIDVCSTGSEESFTYSSCHQQKSRFTINGDGTFSLIEYQLENEDCIITFDEKGVWELNNDNLTLTSGKETRNPTFFELTDNTLRIGYYDNDVNDLCDGGNSPSHHYTEHIRIK